MSSQCTYILACIKSITVLQCVVIVYVYLGLYQINNIVIVCRHSVSISRPACIKSITVLLHVVMLLVSLGLYQIRSTLYMMASDETTQGQEVVECDFCQNPVSFFCRRYGVNLCDACIPEHLRVKSKTGHDVVDYVSRNQMT